MAADIVSLRLENNRLVANAMEPRATLGDYDPAEDKSTLYTKLVRRRPHAEMLKGTIAGCTWRRAAR